jgi:N-acetylglucosaminyl-diphospho-decaprenol L-rhamnosyltransferase
VDISICILTHSQDELLRLCVQSCVREVEASGLSAEVIIIDNASANGAPQRVSASFRQVRMLRNEENLSFSAANNRAIRVTRGAYVLVLNDDVELQPRSLGLMVDKLESDPRIGALGPLLLSPEGPPQIGHTHLRFPHLRGVLCPYLRLDRLFDRWAITRSLFTLRMDLTRSQDADHICGACLLLRREALDVVGLFDEKFHYYFEDVDLCYRMKGAGWRVFYLSEAHVIHYGSATSTALGSLSLRLVFLRSLIYYFKKHSGRLRYYVLRFALALIFAARVPLAAVLAPFRRTSQERNELVRRSYITLRFLIFD